MERTFIPWNDFFEVKEKLAGLWRLG
jgi:hypothetical protein